MLSLVEVRLHWSLVDCVGEEVVWLCVYTEQVYLQDKWHLVKRDQLLWWEDESSTHGDMGEEEEEEGEEKQVEDVKHWSSGSLREKKALDSHGWDGEMVS